MSAVFHDLGKEKALKGQVSRIELIKEVLGRKGVVAPETFLDDFLGACCSLVLHGICGFKLPGSHSGSLLLSRMVLDSIFSSLSSSCRVQASEIGVREAHS
jgi:hypothetical protein